MVRVWKRKEGKISLGESELGSFQSSDVLIKQKTIGVNRIDLLQRDEKFDAEENIVGCEAFGIVEKVGASVKEFKVGDRVAYATSIGGAYAEKRVINKELLIPVPNYISDEDAAAILLKGMLAHMLLRRTFFVNQDSVILIHNAEQGLGQILCPLAKHYGAKVIAAVKNESNIGLLEKAKIDYIIDSGSRSWVNKVEDITKGNGVHLVFDYHGSKTFLDSVKCLGMFGLLVNLMNSYGSEANFDLNELFAKGNFVTSPNIFAYKQDRMELLLSANEVFTLKEKKIISPNIFKKYSFEQAAEAQYDLSQDKVYGQSIIAI